MTRVENKSRQSLDQQSHNFLDKLSPAPDARVKLSLVKLNVFIYRPHRKKGKKGDGCTGPTGEKTIHTKVYIFRLLKELGGGGGG